MKALRNITTALLVTICLATNMFASYTVAPAKSEPQRLKWKDHIIRIALSDSLAADNPNVKGDSDVRGAIMRSLRSWEKAADLEFVIESSDLTSLSPSGAAGDGISLITIAATPENVLLFSKNPFSESAKTRVFYDREGHITEADIVLNPFQQFSTDGTFGTFDLEAALTHEIGHLLGLRHSIVLGSIMSAGLLRNGVLAAVEPSAFSLSDSDIAAVRELYGENGSEEECCAVVSGRITQSESKLVPSLQVWAEASRTGKVAAQTETLPDGTFRLGGLPAGSYTIFWQKTGADEASPIGDLGTHQLTKGETRTLSEKVDIATADMSVNYVGLSSRLSESPIAVNSGREYVVYLGGRHLDVNRLSVEFNSPFFRSMPGSIKEYDLGENVSAISFVLSVDADVLPGVYSIYLTDRDGILGALVGAVKVGNSSLQ